jgi:hypothetical protein
MARTTETTPMLQLSTFRKNSSEVTEQLALHPEFVMQRAGVLFRGMEA